MHRSKNYIQEFLLLNHENKFMKFSEIQISLSFNIPIHCLLEHTNHSEVKPFEFL